MDEMQFDRTRRAIGTDKLDEKDRQQLMQKFTSKGGQVVDERSVKKDQGKGSGGKGAPAEADRKIRQIQGARLPSQLARDQKFSEADQAQKIRRIRQEEEREASSFFARFFVKLTGKMKGVAPFGNDRALPEFLSRLNLDARRAVMECNILSMDLFTTNPEIGRQVLKELDAKNPLYVEILDRAGKLYDRAELSDLLSSYSSDPNSSVAFDAIRVPAVSFLKKLYYLRPFQETYIVAATMAIDAQEKIEKKAANLYASKRKKIRNEWRILMDEIFPLLVILLQRMEMKKAEPGTWLFEDLIKATPEDRPGKRKAGELISEAMTSVPKVEEKKPDAEAKAESEAEGEAPVEDGKPPNKNAEIEYGMGLMRQLSIETLKKLFDVRGEWKGSMINRDKVFLSYLYFKEFEDEYSLILTSSKVRLNANYAGGVKVDYRQKLADAYEEGRSIHDLFRKYHQESAEFKRTATDPVAHTNYVEHAKRMQLIESRRGGSGRQVRVAIKDVMTKIATNLEVIIEDLKHGGQIVANPDEFFRFDVAATQQRKLEGKRIRSCFSETYCYALALKQRVENGDLFGGVIEIPAEEFARNFPGQPAE
ncbi:MAG: hypothetical protein K8S54_07410 [Spirochaetia bacterium]|nr:hypothetical protein [Spirochaetia bacterium]